MTTVRFIHGSILITVKITINKILYICIARDANEDARVRLIIFSSAL